MQLKSLFNKQIRQQVNKWLPSVSFPFPREGWIRFIRKALGMTTSQLAARLKKSRGEIVHFEQAETKGSITLKTLKNIAHAMDCELVYAIVPKSSIDEILTARARKIAKEKLKYISHSMSLENQQLAESENKEQLELMVKALLSSSPKNLWDE